MCIYLSNIHFNFKDSMKEGEEIDEFPPEVWYS